MKKSAMLFCIETTLLFLQASYRSFAVSSTLSGVDYTNVISQVVQLACTHFKHTSVRT